MSDPRSADGGDGPIRRLRAGLLDANPYVVAAAQIALMLASGLLITNGLALPGLVLLLAVTGSNALLVRGRRARDGGRT